MPSSPSAFSFQDVLSLPPVEREVWLALRRTGMATAEALSARTCRDLSQVQNALVALERKALVSPANDGRWQVNWGQARPHTTLPASMWPALLGTDRIYSEQEIATLRTAIPMLQFARARLSEFVDHGPGHALRVKTFASQLGYILDLTDVERHLLRLASFFHDIGNVVDRAEHHIHSQKTVQQLWAAGKLPFTAQEAELIALLCRWHRREYEPDRTDMLRGEPVRTGLVAGVLRVADAMDIDQRRSDYHGKFREVLEFFFPPHMPYWTSLEEVLGLRIHAGPTVTLQVLTRGPVVGNLQIDMLRGDIAKTPFDWSVMPADATLLAAAAAPSSSVVEAAHAGRALVVFPFEAHSLIMSALSRKHLAEAGYPVDLLCYPDTAGGPSWLYRKILPEIGAESYEHIILLGDRPDEAVAADVLSFVRHCRQNKVGVTILNRHEANWSRLPGLRALGAEVIMGGDWAYFWGRPAGEADLLWARIGALCTRDPAQSTVGMTSREKAITEGLLAAVHTVLCEPPADSIDAWLATAKPILDRIAADDQAYFVRQAGNFCEVCAGLASRGRVEGQVVVFDEPPGPIPQNYYWIMEAAIEAHGRAPERGFRFNVPYAVLQWPTQDAVQVLAISHWREEEAIPVRLLLPPEVGSEPQGDESTVRLRIPTEQAAAVIPAVIAACNQARLW